ncbi:MAG: response regulator [Sulfuritalea sp.]|nr:response regulator [Sulfuritalea sp.]
MSNPAPQSQAVQAQLTALLFRNAGIGQAVNLLVASLLAYLGYISRPGPVIVFWWAWMCALSLSRYRLSLRFVAANPAADQAATWRDRYVRSIAMISLSWLVGGGLIMWGNSDPYRFMVGLALAGMVAGAVPILAPVRLAFRIYAVTILLGVALIVFAFAGQSLHWVFGILTLVFLGGVLSSANYLNQTLEASIQLGLEKSELVAGLEKARNDAEAANMAKSEFLATMSHEIRTPMNGILGFAQLLMMSGQTDEERQEQARILFNSAQTLLTLLNDILDFSKIEAGKVELERLAFDPGQLIHESVRLLTPPAVEKGLAIEAAWHGATGQRYWSDPNRLRQMLSNLIGNAIKFTAKGHVRIEGREVERDGDRALLEFSVSDSGIGIPESKRKLLFRAFSQVDSSVTREYGGTGLGLSIVRRLALLMDGDVGIEDAPGQGARVWFRIRASLVGAGEDTRQASRARPFLRTDAPRPDAEHFVLVAEDNPVNRVLVEQTLKKLQIRCQIVDNGLGAVNAITSGASPDLILMDCQMPVMDGFTATENIRRWEREGDRLPVPIVALTASAFQEDRDRCLAAGMDDFLTKPFTIDDLVVMMEKWTQDR